ncbi:MAG: hypothetical protein KGY51_12100 [Psychroflexus sp.]|nr:hypothetical protein [Psychroflexus sp.]
MKITLCDKVLGGDIPEHYFRSKDEAIDFIGKWVDSKNLDESVLVCFQNWGDCKPKELRNEQRSFLVTHDDYEAIEYVENLISSISIDDIGIAIFEFENYQEAFKYCIDLKESF